jgi:molybdate transport system substrate-binding protein
MFRASAVAVFAAWMLGHAQAAAERPPTIAAAANLNFAVTEIAKRFEHDRGLRVDVVFGASGTLTRQIRDGAPFEMFLAADEDFPNQLTASGLTRDAGVVYAVGRLAVAGVPRFAIANPDVAPYGRAAEAALRKHGLWDAIRPRLVLGDSIAQAAQFATTGNTVGGLIAYSLVKEPAFANRGRYALIPQTDHPPLRQRMVLLKPATPAADQFYAYMQGAAARTILINNGYEVPQ